MPGSTQTAALDGDSQQDEQLADGGSAELLKQSARFGTVRHLIETFSDEQWKQLSDLIHLLSYIKISPEDTQMLEAALVQAQANRKVSDPRSENSILPYLMDSLSHNGDSDPSPRVDLGDAVPGLQHAPRDEFRGVNQDGDAYAYLLDRYGVWLQEGRKCLDRPSMTRLDGKLLKALQQKYTRNKRSMPPLSDVFPTVKEAKANREKYGVAGL
jgi:hypothetical protein